MYLNWEEKLNIMQAICEVSLVMRKPGNWYVNAENRELKRKGSHVLEGVYGNGTTPGEAVENDWKLCVERLPKDYYIVVNAYTDYRRAYRWNGTAWKEIHEST